MDLKSNLLHRNYRKAEAKTQITIGEDYSVPEGKPDIASILQKKSELLVEEVHTEKGKIKICGRLKVWVLYLAERSAEIASGLEMEFLFEEIMYMEGAASGDNLKIDWNIDSLQVNLVHPGKLSVRALVSLWGSIDGTQSHQITENVESEEEIYVKTESFFAAEPVIERKENFRVRDEVMLPVDKPNVQNILWENLQIRGLDVRIQDGRLAVKGEAMMLVVYQGEEDSAELQWMEQTVPFHGTVDVPGLTPEMFGVPETEIAYQSVEVKPDYDGERRMFQIEIQLDIHLHLYEERTCNVLKDAYSTGRRLNLQWEELSYEKLRMCSQAKCRVSKLEDVGAEGKILQVIGHQADLQGRGGKITEQGIVMEGMLQVQILYLTAGEDRTLGTAVISIPYSQLIEIPTIQKEDTWKAAETLEQILITMPDSDQIEVRGTINFNVCVMQQCRLQNISAVSSEDYDSEEYQKKPGMIIHFVQPKETLWSIAKSNRLAMEEIIRWNELAADEVVPGQKLLLVKRALENPLL